MDLDLGADVDAGGLGVGVKVDAVGMGVTAVTAATGGCTDDTDA